MPLYSQFWIYNGECYIDMTKVSAVTFCCGYLFLSNICVVETLGFRAQFSPFLYGN